MEDLRHIEQALMAYWRGNPEATHSLQGISRDWLPSADPDKVALVLDRLVRRGSIYSVRAPSNNHVIYKLVR